MISPSDFARLSASTPNPETAEGVAIHRFAKPPAVEGFADDPAPQVGALVLYTLKATDTFDPNAAGKQRAGVVLSVDKDDARKVSLGVMLDGPGDMALYFSREQKQEDGKIVNVGIPMVPLVWISGATFDTAGNAGTWHY